MIYVTKAEYVENYKVYLQFSDLKEGVVDLEDVIKNDHRTLFKELENIDVFKNFNVDMDTIVWKNGLDLAPEFLYARLKNNE